MNVTILAFKLDKYGGGSNISLDLMSRKLEERGNNVKIVTLRPKLNNIFSDRSYEMIEPAQSTERKIYDLDLLPIIRSMLESLNDWTDLFHIFNPYLGPMVGKYCSKFETPFVLRFNSLASVCTRGQPLDNECYKQCGTVQRFKHDDEAYAKRTLKIPEYMFTSKKFFDLINNFNKIFALSPAVKNVIEGMGANGQIVEVIPNFFDPSLENHDTSNPYSVTKTNFDLLFVGRLVQVKRPAMLIEAISKIPESDVRLHIVGDGPMKQELIENAQQLKIDDRIIFHGYVDNTELPSYYSNADLFIHTQSGPYSFSRTVLEAIQFSLPVLTAESGDTKELVGEACKTFRDHSSEDLADQISTILSDSNERTQLQTNCQKKIKEFHPDNIVTKIVGEYENLIERSHSI
jgi:glycosyltransferase involved in cell wall biosynthesis